LASDTNLYRFPARSHMRGLARESEVRMYGFFVLYFLGEAGELSGYELAKTIKDRTRGYFSSTAGNIYPVLRDLEQNGLVKSGNPVGKRRKTLYRITARGRKSLLDLAKTYKERFERITSFFDKVTTEARLKPREDGD